MKPRSIIVALALGGMGFGLSGIAGRGEAENNSSFAPSAGASAPSHGRTTLYFCRRASGASRS